MTDCILIINAGSSSIKFAVFEESGVNLKRIHTGSVSQIGATPKFKFDNQNIKVIKISNHLEAFQTIFEKLQELDLNLKAAGHRVVHGADKFTAPILINKENFLELKKFESLAPLHQPHNLKAIETLFELKSNLPQVACFDTAFHADQPEIEKRLPLPISYHDQGIKRYGFHGLSYEYITTCFEEITKQKLPSKLIVAHLGNGASLAAIKEGKSVATTMGFSTLDGLIMGSRCGSLDPGVLLYLMKEKSESELTDLLYNQSGLLALSEISNEMGLILKSETPQAKLAVEKYCYSVAKQIASLMVPLSGLDCLVFTGGIGENATPIRNLICKQLSYLDLDIDEKKNETSECLISHSKSAITCFCIPTNEEWVIARHTQNHLKN
ncbi:MAG: acetate/propionate family kinase [Halobacteriovoraceae bacterium]|nr:acetate/propionate family kinase [Halobacteriovoraceae bacterium]